MSFIFPWFLFAAISISIPILIHLFHFRKYKKIYFSNTKFLEQITDETEKQSKLKHLLVLISRILAICCLVVAFSRPYIPVANSVLSLEGNAVCVFVDNSFSMEDESLRGNMLDLAKEKARELVNAYDYTDEFMLLTNDFEGKHQRFVSKDEFVSMLNDVKISPWVRSISDIILRQNELFQSSSMNNNTAYIISDYQRNISDIDNIKSFNFDKLLLIPIQANEVDNLYIDSIWIDSPIRLFNQTAIINVRIKNTSSNFFENQPLRLFVNGAQRGVATFDVAPSSHSIASLTITIDKPDIIEGYAEISDFPITFDNNFFFSFKVTSDINVLEIYQDLPDRFLNALFSNDSLFNFRKSLVRNVDYSEFSNKSLIILNGLKDITGGLAIELKRYAENGGSILVFPGDDIDMKSYQDFLEALNVNYYTKLDENSVNVSVINVQHYIYRNVFDIIPDNIDLPVADKYYVLSRLMRIRGDDILVLRNGNSFMSSFPVNKGNIFLSAVGLQESFSNFPRHSVFVPTVYNIALQSGRLQPLYYTIGEEKPVVVSNYSYGSDEVFRISGNDFEIIPLQRSSGNVINLFQYEQIQQSGIYSLLANNNVVDKLSFNYDRRESETFFMSVAEMQSAIDEAALENVYLLDSYELSVDKFVTQMQTGKQLWALFLLLSLGFLLTEVLLLRFLK